MSQSIYEVGEKTRLIDRETDEMVFSGTITQCADFIKKEKGGGYSLQGIKASLLQGRDLGNRFPYGYKVRALMVKKESEK